MARLNSIARLCMSDDFKRSVVVFLGAADYKMEIGVCDTRQYVVADFNAQYLPPLPRKSGLLGEVWLATSATVSTTRLDKFIGLFVPVFCYARFVTRSNR